MNQESDIVIIGCGAGGGTAAQFARKTDRKAKITIYGKETYPQYSKCGLPYTISKTIPKYNDLIEFSEEWFKKNQIDLFLDFTVEKIDVKNQLIKVKIGNNTIEKSYTSLIIATGAQPWIPPIQNIGEARNLLDGVFILRNMDNAKQISSFIKKDNIKKATIIGAGFIGLEIADVLHKMNIEVTLVEAFSNILVNAFDEDIAGVITEEISKNIKLYSNHIATKVEANNKKIQKVYIKNNKNGEVNQINTDLLIISTGCRPNVALGKDAGCRIGKKGGIIVNEKAETTIKDIYAIGDCTEYSDFITGESIISGLGSIAVRQGISAGVNAAGGSYNLPEGFLQTRTSKFFGVEVAAAGPISKYLEKFTIVSGKYAGSSHPDYFPGGKPIFIKVLADEKTSRLLSAQAVGANAALRINTLACGILGKMNVNDFRKLETAYAPPIAPTLDAITLACDIVSMKLKRKNR